MSNTARPISGLFQSVWTSAIVFGILAVILGSVILAWPEPSIVVAAALFGAYLVVSGAAMMVLAFGLPAASGAGRFLNFFSGVISIILGVLAFRHFGEGYALLLLAIWIGVGFIFRGVSALTLAISESRIPGRGWAIFFGIISLIAGFTVLAYPFDSIVTLELVVGIWLIILGATEVVSGFAIRSDAKKVASLTATAGQPDFAR
jgi:uncharacterized membrane protein HdeD (DUF308 family)